MHQYVNVAHISFVRRQLLASVFQNLFREEVPDAPPKMLFRDFAAFSAFQDPGHLHVEVLEVSADTIIC